MTSVRKDFVIKQSRDVKLQFVVTADEGQTLSGAEIQFQVARHVGSTVILFTKEVGNGITITGALTFDIDIDAEDTQDMDGIYYYEVLVTSATHRTTPTYGYITVEDSLMGISSI